MRGKKIAHAFFLVSLVVAPIIFYCFLCQFSGEVVPWIFKLSPGCIFYELTGFKCPGCGGTRALASLVKGDWRQAIAYNVFWVPTFFVLLMEYVNAWLVYFDRSTVYRGWVSFRIFALKTYACLVIVFFIARNIFDF